MDWGFLNIFKKEDRNKLMFGLAVAGWCVFVSPIKEPYKYYILGVALLASVYCISGLVVYGYNQIKTKRLQKRQKKVQELNNKKIEEERRIEIARMFNGLSPENKQLLFRIIKDGKTDSYDKYVLNFPIDYIYSLKEAQQISSIYKDILGRGAECIEISYYTDMVSASIDPYLYNLIEQHANNVLE